MILKILFQIIHKLCILYLLFNDKNGIFLSSIKLDYCNF